MNTAVVVNVVVPQLLSMLASPLLLLRKGQTQRLSIVLLQTKTGKESDANFCMMNDDGLSPSQYNHFVSILPKNSEMAQNDNKI